MKIGTKSVLFGSHCFFIHPWFVALGWWKLYGFPTDYRLWVAFFVHDLGYWGKPNMDGPEGEEHVKWGANLLDRWFTKFRIWTHAIDGSMHKSPDESSWIDGRSWYWFGLCHSRYWAKKVGLPPSRLCYADKLAFVVTPFWIYLPLVMLTGEWKEYSVSHPDQYERTLLGWYNEARTYCRNWVYEHYQGKEDTWTKARLKR